MTPIITLFITIFQIWAAYSNKSICGIKYHFEQLVKLFKIRRLTGLRGMPWIFKMASILSPTHNIAEGKRNLNRGKCLANSKAFRNTEHRGCF